MISTPFSYRLLKNISMKAAKRSKLFLVFLFSIRWKVFVSLLTNEVTSQTSKILFSLEHQFVNNNSVAENANPLCQYYEM